MARLGRPPSVLTYAQAEEIRRRYRPGLGGQLAREFGIRNNYLLDVVAGRVHKPPEQRRQRELATTGSAIRQRRYYARKRGELPPVPRKAPKQVARPQPLPPPDPRAIVRAAWSRREKD